MQRLRSVNSGVVVLVSDETAARLDAEWVPADGPTPKPRAKKPTE